jgi:hypothetical protein
MSLSSFFSSFVGTLHADAPEESKVSEAEPQEVEDVVVEVVEVEEDEPEDVRSLHRRWEFVTEYRSAVRADSPPAARGSARVVQVQGRCAPLLPLPGEGSVWQGLQARGLC